METIEQLIQKKAYALGYEKCGIIPVQMLEGYGEKLEERMKKVPGSDRFYQGQKRLVDFMETYPWAKSVVVVARPFTKYKVPEELSGHIGKSYLFDVRMDEKAEEYHERKAFDAYMKELGLQVATYEKFGIVGMRWAAIQAGLGVVRKNNFFYTESGSWVHIEAWLTDREMKLIESTSLEPCPENCERCVKACPTASLSEPFVMNPLKCISFLTTFGGRDLPKEPLRENFGACVYGCDICQEVCQMNRGKWIGEMDFPSLEELTPHLTVENIMAMEEEFYRQKIQPKFFYLSPGELWKWKVNALNYMDNQYEERFKPYILSACKSEHEKVREMAKHICLKRELIDQEIEEQEVSRDEK